MFDDLPEEDALPVEGGVGKERLLEGSREGDGAVGTRLDAVFVFVDDVGGVGTELGHEAFDPEDFPVRLFSIVAARRRIGHDSTVFERPLLRGVLGVGVFDFTGLEDGVRDFGGDVTTGARTRGTSERDPRPTRFFAGSTARLPRVMTAPLVTFPRARFTRSASRVSFAFPIARSADVRPPTAARVPAAAPALLRALASALWRAIAFFKSTFLSLLTPFMPLSRAFMSKFFTVGDFDIHVRCLLLAIKFSASRAVCTFCTIYFKPYD